MFIIAEAGVNHNGDFNLALEMIDAAAASGADAVKFQTFKSELLVSSNSPLLGYQKTNVAERVTQREMLKRLEISRSQHFDLKKRADAQGLMFLSTPFDESSLMFLIEEIGMKLVKIPSGEITNFPMLLEVGGRADEILLSTGASNLLEIKEAIDFLVLGFSNSAKIKNYRNESPADTTRSQLLGSLTLLQTVSAYPADAVDYNLRTIVHMQETFQCKVGLSDHTLGSHVAAAAAALGAVVFEKHFTLDQQLPGPDHRASLSPEQLNSYVRVVRETASSLGDGIKRVQPAEKENQKAIRKSIYAIADIRAGQLFTPSNVGLRRPATGLPPRHWWNLLTTRSKRNYRADEPIDLDEVL